MIHHKIHHNHHSCYNYDRSSNLTIWIMVLTILVLILDQVDDRNLTEKQRKDDMAQVRPTVAHGYDLR